MKAAPRRLWTWLPTLPPRVSVAFGEASNGLTLLLFVLLARLLGVESYGRFVSIIAASAILQAVAEFGFFALLARLTARTPREAWPELRSVLLRQGLACLPLAFVLPAYLAATDVPATLYPIGLLFGLAACLRALKESVRGVCRGLSRFDLEALFNWTERLSLLIGGATVLLLGGGLFALGLVYFTVRVIDFTIFLTVMRSLLLARSPDRPASVSTFLAALPFAISGLLGSMYYQIDTALLAVLSTPRDTGIYGSLYRFVDIMLVAPRILIGVAFPAMAVSWLSDRAHFRETFRSLQLLLTCAGLPALFALIAWSGFFVQAAFGPAFAEAGGALGYVMLGTFFAFQTQLFTQALQTSGHERDLAAGLTGIVVLNVGLNLWLIPRYGFEGAAIATLVTELAYFAVLAAIARLRGVAIRPFGITELAGAAVLAGVTFGAHWLAAPWALPLLAILWAGLLVHARPDRLLLGRSS